jgi:RNA recognition motif-containing protein
LLWKLRIKEKVIIMAKPRNLLYVGGLENEVTEDILFAAFVPFGPLRSVQIPKDFKESKTCFEK